MDRLIIFSFLCCDFSNTTNTRKKYRGEEDSGSGVDTQTSETRESDDYYGNLKKIQGSQIIQQALGDQKLLPALWINDKSDLDSLDSDYFKNSLHQLDGSGIYSAYDHSLNRKDKGIETNSGCVLGTPDVSIANGYIDDDNLSLRSDGHEQSPLPDYCTIKTEDVSVVNNYVSNEDVSVIHANSELDNTNPFKSSANNLTICESDDHHIVSNIEVEEIERKSKFKEDRKSVISYDSIYLSSEGSNEAATIIEEEEKINEYLSDNNYSTLSEYTSIKRDIKTQAEQPIEKQDGENLYSQINKPHQHQQNHQQQQPKTTEGEIKTKLTTFSDISNRGTLERLTFISSPASAQKEANKVEKVIPREPIAENQYCSLPVANIGKSLQASERIDAKLRSSCYPLKEQTQIYDSITNFGRAHKKLRQRESYDINNTPSSLPIEERPKEASFVDVKPNIRELYAEIPSSPVKITFAKCAAAEQHSNKLLKIDEEISSLISAELNEIENSSSKNCEIEEIRERPEKIKVALKAQPPIETISSPDIQIIESHDNIIEETIDVPVVKLNRSSNGHKSYQKSHHSKRQLCSKSGDRQSDYRDRAGSNLKVNLSNTLKRRLENKTRNHLNDKLARNIDKSKSNKNIKVQQAILENITSIAQPNFNMSRPQIMHVIDSRRNLPRSAQKNSKQNKENEMINVNTTVTGGAKREMLQKVDSVRNYWSKLMDGVEDCDDTEGEIENIEKNEKIEQSEKGAPNVANRVVDPLKSTKTGKNTEEIVVKAPSISISNNTLKRAASAASGLHSLLLTERDELNSYTPSVEIVELDDQKQATIVKVQGIDTPDFDHVRYKVMKTDTFQKNMLTQSSRKEAPLDGLLQYLTDYSFQVIKIAIK